MARLPPRLPPRVGKRSAAPRGGGPARKPPGPLPPRRPAGVSPKRVAAAFRGSVRPVRASVGYQIVSLFAAAFVLLLPAAYLALIGAVGWAVYYHFTEHAGMLSAGRGRGRVLMGALYILPGFAGAAALLALVKPLAAPEAGREQWRVLHRKSQPTLFALIDRVCEAVHAPKPDRVHVDAEVNMSAGHRGGFLGLFGGRFILTVGLPMAAGLGAAGFAGMMAHEFGHFAQRGGRGVGRAAGSVQSWLARTVYKRDAVDAWIAEACEADSWLVIFAWVCALCVWLVRQVLKVLLYASAVATSALSRQMEFDADRYETRLAGADAFVHNTRRSAELNLGFRSAMNEVLPALAAGNPPEDLPALCVHHAPRLSEAETLEADAEMRSGMGLAGGVFSSHPTTARRLAAARREGAKLDDGPALDLDGPAAALFADFPALCRHVTLDFYRANFGRRPDPGDLAPVRPLPPDPHRPDRKTSSKRRKNASGEPAADGAEVEDEDPNARPLPYGRAELRSPGDLSKPEARAVYARRLSALRRRADAATAELAQALKRYHRRCDRRDRALETLAAAGAGPAAHADGPADWHSLSAKLEAADRARDEAELAVFDAERPLAEARLAALDPLADAAFAAKLPDRLRTGVEVCLAFSEAARSARPAARAARDAALRLMALLRAAAAESRGPGSAGPPRAEVDDRTAALSSALSEMRRALLGVADPFAVPEDPKQTPTPARRTFEARLPAPDAADGPVAALAAAARGFQELAAALAHVDRVLAARADWAARRLAKTATRTQRPPPAG